MLNHLQLQQWCWGGCGVVVDFLIDLLEEQRCIITRKVVGKDIDFARDANSYQVKLEFGLKEEEAA